MRKNILFTIFVLFVFGQAWSQCLSGGKVIGSGNYTTFGSAVDSLITYSVCGPVVFTISPGTYFEEVSIPAISGASAQNTITFISKTHDSTQVVLKFSGDYTLKLDGADHIRFRYISITNTDSRVIEITNSADNNIISNCLIQGSSTGSDNSYFSLVYSNGTNDMNNVVTNTHFFNGSNGIYLVGNGNVTGTVIKNNIFDDQSNYGVYVEKHNSPQIQKNIVHQIGAYYSIWAQDCPGGIQIEQNSCYDGGIVAYGCIGSVNNPSVIANNFVYSVFGSGIINHYSDFVNNNFNTVLLDNGPSYTAALYCGLENQNISAYGNILLNRGPGLSVLLKSELISDHNVLYSDGTYLASTDFSGAVNYSSLSTWQAAIGIDSNSINWDQLYVTSTDYHLPDSNSGYLIASIFSVPKDIDGDPRDQTETHSGADEYFAAEIFISPDTTILCGESVQLSVSVNFPDAIYSWTPTMYLDTPTVNTPIASSGQTTTYWVTATDGIHTKVSSTTVTIEPVSGFTYITDKNTVDFTMLELGCSSNSFAWTFGDGSSNNTVQNASHTFVNTGSYIVCLICDSIISQCSSCEEVIITQIDTTTHLAGADLDENIRIYPNPVSAVINIIGRNDEIYQLIDAEGRILKQGIVSPTTILDVGNLENGIYILCVTSSSTTVKQKIIISR